MAYYVLHNTQLPHIINSKPINLTGRVQACVKGMQLQFSLGTVDSHFEQNFVRDYMAVVILRSSELELHMACGDSSKAYISNSGYNSSYRAWPSFGLDITLTLGYGVAFCPYNFCWSLSTGGSTIHNTLYWLFASVQLPFFLVGIARGGCVWHIAWIVTVAHLQPISCTQ